MIRLVILFFLTLILQTGLLPGLFLSIETPEMFIPVIVAISILYSEKTAITFALIAGFIMDFYFLKAFGVRTFLFFLIAYFLSKKSETLSHSVFSIITITFLIGLMYHFLYFIFINIHSSISLKTLVSSIFSLETPILMIYSIIVFSILNKENRRR